MQTLKKIGFSKGDLLNVVWLFKTQIAPMNAKELHEAYTTLFPSVPVRYEYVAKIAHRLDVTGDLKMVHQIQQKKYYQVTSTGLQTLDSYHVRYSEEIHELTLVMERIHYELTHDGKKPNVVERPLPAQFRGYVAKLISVKDITRYIIFRLGRTRTELYAAEAIDMMNSLFGWAPSNGYFYEIVREMEMEGTITGRWKDEEKRTVRLIQITSDGVTFAKQVTLSLTDTVKNVLTYLNTIECLISSPEKAVLR